MKSTRLFCVRNLCVGILLLAAGGQAQTLFVAQYGSSNIVEITPGGTTNIFASVPTSGAVALAFDPAGNLYTGADDGNIYKFAPDGTRSLFATGAAGPAITFDQSGDMYIADFGAGKVTEISANGTQSIFATGVPDAFDLTFDRAGNLYVSDGPDQTVTEIMANGTKSTFASGLSDPIGLAFDGSGNLFVVCELVEHIVEINPEGVTNHFASVVGNYAKFDAAGNLFMTGMGSGEVLEFAPNGSQSVFASGLNQPMGLAFQPQPQLQGNSTNGTFQLAVTMPSPYYSTIVQVSTNLMDWSDIYTNLPPFAFTDSAVVYPNRYYRAILGQ